MMETSRAALLTRGRPVAAAAADCRSPDGSEAARWSLLRRAPDWRQGRCTAVTPPLHAGDTARRNAVSVDQKDSKEVAVRGLCCVTCGELDAVMRDRFCSRCSDRISTSAAWGVESLAFFLR